MSESRKIPSGNRNRKNTTATTNDGNENGNGNSSNDGDNDDYGNNNNNNNSIENDIQASSDPRSSPMNPSAATRPNRDVPDEEAFDCRPTSPPKRTTTPSESEPERHRKSVPSLSAPKKQQQNSNSNSNNNSSSNSGAVSSSKTRNDKSALSLQKKKKTTTKKTKTAAVATAASSTEVKKATPGQQAFRSSRAKRNIEKTTRVTTRAASSSYAGKTNHDRSNNDCKNTGNCNENEYIDEYIDDDTTTDHSLSTAPDPPSLAVGDHYSLQPGAYRMYTGGVARYVNGTIDDIDDDSSNSNNNNNNNTLNDTGVDDNNNYNVNDVNAVAFEASLVEDDALSPPPLYRPTTSEGYTFSDHQINNSSRNRSSNMEENYTERRGDGYRRRTDRSIGGGTSTAPTAMTYISRTTAAIEEDSSSFGKDDHDHDHDDTDEIIFFSKRKMVITVSLVVILIIVLASIAAMYAIKGSSNESPSLPPSNRPTILPSELALESFIKALPDYTKTNLQTENSPQSKALNWMTTYDDTESYPLPRQLQRFALISLFFSIMQNDPSHDVLTYLAGFDECGWWNNSTCVDGTYTGLWLNSKNNELQGTIIPELALLTSLEVLRIDKNRLTGFIPTELGQMTALKDVRMNNNLFRGTIPTEFGKLSNLKHIDLSNNLLSGSIPTEIGSWNKLETLILAKNALEENIPIEIGGMTLLENISVSSNQLEGPLPDSIRQLRRIKRFDAEKNYLDGEFVSKFKNRGRVLQQLQLGSNEFAGTLSSTIGLLTNLVELDISRNKLRGALPTEVGLMTSLTRLQLYSNKFGDSIPTELGMLSNAESMGLHNNLFTGAVPSEICELTSACSTSCVLTRTEVTVDCDELLLLCNCCSCALKFKAP